ncbi:GNAT family N-acetyltransferase [Vibrio sp. ZSDZ34]|uniref:GNAT family N-acetyltransferase n=1 Tax=Vibrio gelatinilyticus TaxID=2893468 RepID=A0A9X1W9X2_9VIBR|nr:GNAT family N-acetyltransferase [Vibrio gelatinilyticus]MCJ2376411.1 GNAT family N-acetyltransferase [Vibrio gelatinilyticus]
MEFKCASITEIDDLAFLFGQYMEFYKQPLNPKGFREYLIERLNNQDATVYIAYENEDKPVGFILNYHSFSSLSLGKVIVLNDLFVVPNCRGKGVASALIDCSVSLAKSTGAVCVELGTAKDNRLAQALYEKIGFVKDTKYYSYSLSVK